MRIHKKEFNEETKLEALELLQFVTPTDNNHQAHWYDSTYGQKIMAVQNNFIDDFKNKFLLCKNKMEVHKLIQFMYKPKWPSISNFPIDLNDDFLVLIYKEWGKMFNNFINFLNTLN